MSLELERKSLGVRRLLRHLRGTSPKPPSPEDAIQGLLDGESPGISANTEDAGSLASASTSRPSKGSALLQGLRSRKPTLAP